VFDVSAVEVACKREKHCCNMKDVSDIQYNYIKDIKSYYTGFVIRTMHSHTTNKRPTNASEKPMYYHINP
jgi:hypothetical protein